MSLVFFTSSAGDTDLAKATIAQLIRESYAKQLLLVPLTQASQSRLNDIDAKVEQISITELLGLEDFPAFLDDAKLAQLSDLLKEKEIQRAYIGVPSPQNEDLPFQIAKAIETPSVIVNEFMYKDPKHNFWGHIPKLVEKGCEFAMPLNSAAADVNSKSQHAKVSTIGHLSIDRALSKPPMIFVSGSTRPLGEDSAFLEALLSELKKGSHPNLQLRFGIHPGVRNMDTYLLDLLQVCARCEELSQQLKIVLPSRIEDRLCRQYASPFLLREDLSGPELADKADGISQVVPGALINEAHLNKKAVYCHTPVKSYLTGKPKKSITMFFNEVCSKKTTYSDLGLETSTPEALSSLMKRKP